LEEELTPSPESGDEYVNAEVMLPRGNAMQRGRVVKRKRDDDGNIVGTANANPILDTRVYKVMFHDGKVTELAANTIATSMYAQCDVDGNEYLLLEAFVDHQKSDTALTLEQQKFNHNGRPYIRKSTASWKLCCQWLDGSTSWVCLSELSQLCTTKGNGGLTSPWMYMPRRDICTYDPGIQDAWENQGTCSGGDLFE
jgi:hypothetical protein